MNDWRDVLIGIAVASAVWSLVFLWHMRRWLALFQDMRAISDEAIRVATQCVLGG